MLIGLLVFRHSGVNTKTMLERDRMRIDGSDCSVIDHPKNESSNSRLLIEGDNHVNDDMVKAEETEAHVDYFQPRKEEDSFSDDSLLDLVHAVQQKEVVEEVKVIFEKAAVAGLEAPLL